MIQERIIALDIGHLKQYSQCTESTVQHRDFLGGSAFSGVGADFEHKVMSHA